MFHAHGPLYYCSRSRTTRWWIFLRASPYASLVPETTPPHIVANQGGWQRGCTCGKNTGSPTVNGDGILPTPVSPCLLSFPLSVPRTRILPSRLPASMMVFSLLPTSSPFFLPLLPAGVQTLSLRAQVCLSCFASPIHRLLHSCWLPPETVVVVCVIEPCCSSIHRLLPFVICCVCAGT